MTISISVGTWNSGSNGYIVTECKVSPPTRKTKYIQIPYRSGSIDLSDFNGAVYEYRTISITLYKICNIPSDFANEKTTLFNAIENQGRCHIGISNETSYYIGRCTIKSCEITGSCTMKVTMNCDVEPYKGNGAL